jgi:two-component system, OmpR family, sensor histidine kinase BaeS
MICAMRARLAHQLTLLLCAAVGFALLSVALAVAWNLRSGAAHFIRDRETQRLERFARYVGDRAGVAASLPGLVNNRASMGEVVDGFLEREGVARPLIGESPREFGGEPERTSLPPLDRDIDAFRQHVQLLDAQATLLGGRALPTDAPLLTRPVVAAGRRIGSVRLALPEAPAGGDAEFLRRQYLGLAAAVAASLAVSVCAGVWVARRWSRPLVALQRAAREVAAGRFEIAPMPASDTVEVAALSADVTAMAAALQRLEASRREWMAEISHELRTPLTVLQGEIESAIDGVRVPDLGLIRSLGDEVKHMAHLVDDLHLLAMADLGALPCRRIRVDPFATLTEIVARLMQQSSLQGLKASVDSAPTAAIEALWDTVRIEQMLRNLLQNSERHTARPGEVRVGWALDESMREVTLRIEDTAPGVASEDLPKLFEPLFRTDRARRRSPHRGGSGSGSGLGLAIVQAIVAAHGGRVSAAASALGGLAITVQLPIGAR